MFQKVLDHLSQEYKQHSRHKPYMEEPLNLIQIFLKDDVALMLCTLHAQSAENLRRYKKTEKADMKKVPTGRKRVKGTNGYAKGHDVIVLAKHPGV